MFLQRIPAPVVAVLLVLFLLLHGGCPKEEDDDSPTGPNTSEGNFLRSLTGTDGRARFENEDFALEVAVRDESDLAMAEVEVLVFRGIDWVCVSAQDSGYYGGFEPIDISTDSSEYSLSLTLLPVTGYCREMEPLPGELTGFREDAGFNEYERSGSPVDIQQVIGAIGRPAGVFHLHGDAAELRGGERAVLFQWNRFADTASTELFTELLFRFAELLPDDRVEFHFYSVSVNDTEFYLPYIGIHHLEETGDPGDFKFYLTWGSNPEDLDGHLYTPSMGPQNTEFHVYYGNHGARNDWPYAWLDVDDVDSYGPEVITIMDLQEGIYRYAVHDFRGTGTITGSDAEVRVYRERELVEVCRVPDTEAEERWWWYVGDVDGASATFEPVNSIQERGPGGSPPGEPLDVAPALK